MTEHDFDKDFPYIFLIILFTCSLVALGFVIRSEESSVGKTEIVGRYKNCDIVRWTDPSSRYQYFLHCPQ